MKKAFALIVLIVTPTMAFAQGLLGFVNNSAGLVREWTSSSDPTLIPVPVGGGMVELLTAPAYTAFNPFGEGSSSGFYLNYPTLEAFLGANPGWQSVATVGFTTPAPGRFNGGTVTLQSSIPGGANAEYVIIGWTGPAATFDQAMEIPGTWFSSSPMLTTTTGSGGTPPIPATLLSATFPGMILGTPEPTTFALAGLGLAALLVFHRRR